MQACEDGEAVLDASVFKGYAVKTWIGFLSNDEMNASDSVWTRRGGGVISNRSADLRLRRGLMR